MVEVCGDGGIGLATRGSGANRLLDDLVIIVVAGGTRVASGVAVVTDAADRLTGASVGRQPIERTLRSGMAVASARALSVNLRLRHGSRSVGP